MEGLVIQLIIMGIFGGITAAIASSRGRSAVAWFFIGVILGCIGLILVLVLPDLKVQAEREERIMRENRRLRERLRKDRMVADLRHQQSQRRFAAHDVALGVDTGDSAPAQIGVANPPPMPDENTGSPSIVQAQWHYIETTDPQGPIPFENLKSLWSEGRLRPESYVWTEGMDDWRIIAELPELEAHLDA